jgi:hypothetical protein
MKFLHFAIKLVNVAREFLYIITVGYVIEGNTNKKEQKFGLFPAEIARQKTASQNLVEKTPERVEPNPTFFFSFCLALLC